MVRSGKVWFIVLFVASINLTPMPSANAAYLYDWTTAQMFTDPVGDTVGTANTGRDIVSAFHAFDGTYSYFRMSLASAPVEAYDWTTKYGIYIDNKAGGAPASNYYVPQIPDIDGRIDSVLYAWPNQWVGKYRYWTGADFSDSITDGVLFQHSEDGGKTLEWRFDGDFGPSFTWYAAVLLEGYSDSIRTTYDYVASPIPSSAWLLGAGILALIFLRRRGPGRT